MSKNVTTISSKNEFSSIRALIKNNIPAISIIALVLLSICVYSPVFNHQFQMKWDDQWVVVNTFTENGLNKYNIRSILTEFYHGQYAPVNQLSYTLLYSAFGYDPLWFHTFSLLIHVSNVILVYFVIRKLLLLSRDFTIRSIQRISFFTALIMAVHPFLVESVAWLSASKILIYSLFYLLAVLFYLKYLEHKQITYYISLIFLFLLSFGGKEQAVTLPVCLVLIDIVLKRNMRTKQVWIEKLPIFMLSAIFGYITILSQSVDGVGLLSTVKQYPFYQNIVFASYSISEYFSKCLFPIKLSYLYPFPNEIGQPLPIRFWIYPALLLIIFVSFIDFLKKRWIFFGISFFIIHLGVALHIIPISRFAIIADRYAYIASIGIFFLMAYWCDKLLDNPKYKNITATLAFIYILSIGTYAYQRSRIWHDSDGLKKELNDLIIKRNEFQNHNLKK